MRLVVLESPYAGDIDRNVRYARLCMRDSLNRGEAPYASHLLYTQPMILADGIPEEREKGMRAGFAWGTCAGTCAVYTDFGVSPGMLEGIAYAKQRGASIFYRTLPPPLMARMSEAVI